VIVFHLMGRHEYELDTVGSFTFEELETGERLKVSTAVQKESYTAQLKDWISTSRSWMLEKQINYHLAFMDEPPPMVYRRGPNGGNQRYATLMNYFCTSPTFNVGDTSRSSIVNAKARLQCHAKEFKSQPYAKGKINIAMIDYYHLPSNKDNALDAQAAIRNGDFGPDVANCVTGSQPSCRATGSSCSFFGSCGDCCEGSRCRFWIFGCKCSS